MRRGLRGRIMGRQARIREIHFKIIENLCGLIGRSL